MQAQHMAELVPDRITKLDFFCFSDSSFFVFSDQATIIGVSKANKETIVKQNIRDHSQPIVAYAANIGLVATFTVVESNNTLFAGLSHHPYNEVVQYDLSTGQVVKNYGYIGFHRVLSGTRVGNLWLFRSGERHQFSVIDPVTKQIVHEPVNTAITDIFCFTTCTLHRSDPERRVLLFVAGQYPNYTDRQCSDIFDVTDIIKKFSVSSSNHSRALDVQNE